MIRRGIHAPNLRRPVTEYGQELVWTYPAALELLDYLDRREKTEVGEGMGSLCPLRNEARNRCFQEAQAHTPWCGR